MSFGAQPRADIPAPPSHDVEWCVRMPPLQIAEHVDPRRLVRVVDGEGSVAWILARRIPRSAFVIARNWIDARRAACLRWARLGVSFNPQDVIDAEVFP